MKKDKGRRIMPIPIKEIDGVLGEEKEEDVYLPISTGEKCVAKYYKAKSYNQHRQEVGEKLLCLDVFKMKEIMNEQCQGCSMDVPGCNLTCSVLATALGRKEHLFIVGK